FPSPLLSRILMTRRSNSNASNVTDIDVNVNEHSYLQLDPFRRQLRAVAGCSRVTSRRSEFPLPPDDAASRTRSATPAADLRQGGRHVRESGSKTVPHRRRSGALEYRAAFGDENVEQAVARVVDVADLGPRAQRRDVDRGGFGKADHDAPGRLCRAHD